MALVMRTEGICQGGLDMPCCQRQATPPGVPNLATAANLATTPPGVSLIFGETQGEASPRKDRPSVERLREAATGARECPMSHHRGSRWVYVSVRPPRFTISEGEPQTPPNNSDSDSRSATNGPENVVGADLWH